MQNVATRNEIVVADRKVGIVIGFIGTFVAAFMAATVWGLSLYHTVFYTWLH